MERFQIRTSLLIRTVILLALFAFIGRGDRYAIGIESIVQEETATQDSAPPEKGQQDVGSVSAIQEEAKPSADPNEAVVDNTVTIAVDPSFETKLASPKLTAEQLLSLGSLDPAGEFRYLVTLSTKGAAIVRVELNARDRNGRLAYRDLEHFGGYIGQLELTDTPDGVRVGVVGNGTPADLAGITSGDIIRALNDEPITSVDDFLNQIRKTKATQEVAVRIERDQQIQNKSVRLTDQPLEIIKDEINFVEEGVSSPPSFLMQLLGKTDTLAWEVVDSGMMTGEWQSKKFKSAEAEGVEFSYEISNEKLTAVGLSGPITVRKRFSLPILKPEDSKDLNSRTFHVDFQLLIENQGATAIEGLGVQIDGPTGATTEGWWYQNKIHGRASAIGYLAGARDIVTSTNGIPYRFDGGPEIVADSLKTNPQIFFTISPPENNRMEPKFQEVRYLGVDTQYFDIALLPTKVPTNSEEIFRSYSAIARVASDRIPKEKKLHRKVDTTFMLFSQVNVSANESYDQSFQIFAGPKQKALLNQYGLQDNLTYGWFAMFSKFLCSLLWLFYNMTFQFSYGIAIILLTVLVRLCMLPISRRAAKNAQMMQLLAPEMKRIADKYKDDFEKRAQAQKDLFRRHKYNPAGGCLLMFLQLPIFIGLYRGLSVDIALRDQPLLPGMQWCSNLAAPDQLFHWKEWMPAFLGSESGWLGPYFNVLPLITIALFLVQQKLFTPPPTDDQQKLAQKMMSFMMIFMGVMFFKVPAGLCIYFITSSIWGILERKLLPKPQMSEDKINSIKQSIGDNASSAVMTLDAKPRKTEDSGKTPGGFFDRIRDAIEAQKKNRVEAELDPESKRAHDKERRKRLKDKGL